MTPTAPAPDSTDRAAPPSRDAIATWTVLARVLLNLDETQTKE